MKFARLCDTCFGIGYLPRFPGTWGSLLGLGITWFLVPSDWRAIILWIALFFLGAMVSSKAEEELGHDARPIVIDEVMGMGLALLLAPKRLVYYIGAFILFRLFDTFKPFPARRAEKLPGGWGVMADDLVAGVYALAIMQIILHLVN